MERRAATTDCVRGIAISRAPEGTLSRPALSQALMEAARDGDLPVIAHCVESGTPTDEGRRTATLHCHLPFLWGFSI